MGYYRNTTAISRSNIIYQEKKTVLTILSLIVSDSFVYGGSLFHFKRPIRMGEQSMMCNTTQDSEVWIQNRCYGGFLMINDMNQIVIKNAGVSRNHPDVKFSKESCVNGFGTKETILTRLLSTKPKNTYAW